MPSLLPHPGRIARLPLILLALAAASAASATPLPCSNATLKGTYLYNESGVLNGKPYAESGREVYDGQGGTVVSFQGSNGSGGVEKATYSVSNDCISTTKYPDGEETTGFISPDGSRLVYTIKAAPGSKPTALSGLEIRVDP